MTGFGFLVFFGPSCLLFLSEGKVSPPSHGTRLTLIPGSTGKIVWSFDDTITSLTRRIWSFTSNDGQLIGLAESVGNGQINILTSPLDVAVENDATLVLKNVNQTYDGTYQFALVPSVGDGTSQVVVSIAAKPNVTFSCSSSITVNEGDNSTCVCRGEGGNPTPNVTWYKNGVQIGETGTGNKTLTLINVNETDGGTYKCEARSHTNDLFADEKSIKLVVRQLTNPNITSFTVTPDPKEGQKVTMTCISNGVPSPDNNILRNGTEVSTLRTSTEVSTEKTSTTYTIDSVTLGDAGIYTCIAKNKVGSVSATVNLTVQGQIAPTPAISTSRTSQTASSPTSSTTVGPTPTPTTPPPPVPIPVIIGIIVGVLVLIIIVVVVVYCYKSKQKERGNRANIDPVPGNHYELENEEPGPGDGAYDSVGPVGASGSKSKPPAGNTLPPVYAAVDKNNRQGNTLYASLDTEALKTSRASKKEPDRPPQAEYASIDFGKSAPKADLV